MIAREDHRKRGKERERGRDEAGKGDEAPILCVRTRNNAQRCAREKIGNCPRKKLGPWSVGMVRIIAQGRTTTTGMLHTSLLSSPFFLLPCLLSLLLSLLVSFLYFPRFFPLLPSTLRLPSYLSSISCYFITVQSIIAFFIEEIITRFKEISPKITRQINLRGILSFSIIELHRPVKDIYGLNIA